MIVVDASTLVELLLQGEASRVVWQRMFRAGESWHAPELIDLEVLRAPLITLDARLAASHGHHAPIELFQRA